jgi:diguanylate cyclase (GGDEF)-like protein
MRIPFKIKLGLTITLLTVGLTTATVYHFYALSTGLMRKQVTGRLRDIGHTSTFMLNNEDRAMIARLRDQLNRVPVDVSKLKTIQSGTTFRTLTEKDSTALHNSADVGKVIQFLRKIKLASLNTIDPLRDYYPQRFTDLPDGVLAYILIEIPESPDRKVLKFLASADPEPELPKWPGNPSGDLYVPNSSIFSDAFKGEFQVADHYYTDQFYTCLSAVVPIKDKNGTVIAVLGLDYVAGTEQDALKKLRTISVYIILSSFIVSIALSLLATRYLISLENQNKELKDYSEDLEQMVQARTLALQEANNNLQTLVTTDELTQIFNRRYFDSYLQTEWERSQRHAAHLSLIMCDVDYFKAYNDTYGHQSGDDCLYQVAQGIARMANRSADRVVRYGGEEFAVILPNTNRAGALEVAENIRKHIKTLNLPHPSSPIAAVVTISLGVASTIPLQGQDKIEFIQEADRKLYQAKQNGRDRVARSSS